MIAPASTSTLLAQGYGPDPFRPYNSQYDPYTYPMGPASPAGGGRSDIMTRMGNSGANQYQGYLDELAGQARQGSERYGIGMPYYRSAVDPNFDPEGNARISAQPQGGSVVRADARSDHTEVSGLFHRKGPQEAGGIASRLQRDSQPGLPRDVGPARTRPRLLEAANGEQYSSEAVRCHGSRGRGQRAERRGRRRRRGHRIGHRPPGPVVAQVRARFRRRRRSWGQVPAVGPLRAAVRKMS